MKNIFCILQGLLLLAPLCWAQTGYQYGRNDLNAGVPATVASPLRPLAGGFASGSTAAGAFPTAPTAFGGGGGTPNPAGPFGSFATSPQNQRGIGGLTAGGQTAFGGAATNIPKRTNLQQRPTATGGSGVGGGIYNPNIAQQFGNTATGRGGVSASGSGNLDNDYDGDYSAIPGVPGVDYPVFSQVPQTNFDCNQQPLPGYYSDIEAQCQVFHICALNRTYSFLCPNGTIFSQEVLVCVWWNQYDCASAPSLYANNAFIYDYGNERIPTNAGYQPNANQQQIGRGQTNIIATNTGRGGGNTPGNIFTPQRLQPSVTGTGGGGNIAVQPSSLTGVQPTGGFNAAASNAGRFNPAAQTGGNQPFPATPTPFGAVLRPGPTAVGVAAGGGGGGGGGPTGFNANVGETAFGNAAIATPTTKNREYLPPPSRRQ